MDDKLNNHNYIIDPKDGQHKVNKELHQAFEKQANAQSKATAAYQALLESFEYIDDIPVHPSEYAGARINQDNKLHIYLTTADAGVIECYKSILGELSDAVIFEVSQYSLNDLDSLKTGAIDFLKGDFPVTCWFNSVDENKVIIELDTSETQAFEKALNAKLSTRLFSNNYGIDKRFDLSQFNIRQGEVYEPCAYVYGGEEIRRGSTSGNIRSVGVCGTVRNSTQVPYAGIITAGHDLTGSGTSTYIYKNGQYFGNAIYSRYFDGANGDFACIYKGNANETLTNRILGSAPNLVRNITGVVNDVAAGNKIYHVGASTGYKYGSVSANNVTVNSAGYSIHGLTRVNFALQGGDSGSPFYTLISGSNYNFAGIAQSTATASSVFTPYKLMSTYFTPYTSAQ